MLRIKGARILIARRELLITKVGLELKCTSVVRETLTLNKVWTEIGGYQLKFMFLNYR